MAKVQTLIAKESAKLSDSEKATLTADKAIVAVLKSGDKAKLSTFFRRVEAVRNVLEQTADGQGKRFSGAEDHSFEANVTAYADTVVRGNIAKIA